MRPSKELRTAGREPIRFLTHPLALLASGLARAPALRPWLAYCLAVAATALAAAIRFGLGSLVGPALSPFVTFYPMVMFVGLFAGTGPGLLASILAAFCAACFFLPPAGLRIGLPADQVAFTIFFAVNVGLALVCGALRSARQNIIAQARRAEASEERFRLFMEHTPMLAWVKDDRGRYIYLNKAGESLIGSQCLGKTDAQLWPPEIADRLEQADRKALGAGHPVETTEEIAEADGGRTFWLNTKFPFRDASGRQFLANLGLDITAAKRAEEALREQAQLEQLRADAAQVLQQPAAVKELLQKVAALLVERLDAAFARVWTIEPAEQILELQASAGLYTHLDGGHARVPVGQLKIGRIAQQRQPLVTNQVVGDPHIPEQDWARREGLVAFAGFPLIAAGRLLGVVALFARRQLSVATIETFRDVAGILAQALARKQAEQAFFKEKEFSENVINSLPGVFYVFDAQNHLRGWNRNLEFLSGYSAEELTRLTAFDLLAPEQRTLAAQAIAKVFATGEASAELLLFTKEGRKIPFVFTGRRLEIDGQPGFLGVGLDITQRKEAEALLERRNRHLQILHQAGTRLLLGQEPVELLSSLHQQIAQTFGADVFMVYQAEPGNGHLRLRACGGLTEEDRRKVETLRYGRAICTPPAEALQPIIATHIQTVEAPNRRFVRKLGLRSYLCYPLILNDRLQGTLALASRERDDYDPIDLEFFHTLAGTLAEALERRRLESELERHTAHLETLVRERTAKLEETIAELELFSYTITHDMRAPLRAMTGFADVLASAHSESISPKGRELLRRISEGAVRMDHLITDALQYSQVIRSQIKLRRLDPAAVVRGIVECYPEFHPPKAQIEIQADMPHVLANEAALTQVFSNLLGNAVKFVVPGVTPRIHVWAEMMPSHASRTVRGARLGGKPQPATVRIWVEDNGIGIAPEHHDKIWQMFHQLNKRYEGTGIGLALVRKVVERMHGTVGVESEQGRGSRFWIELPYPAESGHSDG